MHTLLLAISPPDHIEQPLDRLRERLFRRHALVSALALPPLLPLGFLEEEAVPGLRGVLEGLRAAFPLEAGGIREEEGALFLAVDSGGSWAALREAIGRARPLRPGFLPLREGFFLACLEPGAPPEDLLGAPSAGGPPWPPAPPLGRFSPRGFSLLEIHSEPPLPWWRDVRWSEILSLPFRETAPPG